MRVAHLSVVFATIACDKPATIGAEKPSAPASAVASAPTDPSELPPAGCKASGKQPLKLATVVGEVYGFDQDATKLYFSSWSLYGGRGDVGTVRKDGGGLRSLSSLKLEPRGLALDESDVYFTSGIRLMAIPKTGGHERMVLEIFPSHDVALKGSDVYGVPGDYGPYDRLAKTTKKGASVDEIGVNKRPVRDVGPNGFSRLVLDDKNVYVTDSGGNKVLSFPLAGGKAKALATGQDRAYELALAGDDLYFTLARKGLLMRVSKAGGAAKKVAAGLVELSPLAADDKAAYAMFAGEKEDSPHKLSKVGEVSVSEITQVPSSDSVAAMALDKDCVYWAQRKSATETLIFASAR
jgi:hypothetical protein